MLETLNLLLPLIWHFSGLLAVVIGFQHFFGWFAVLIVVGMWAMLSTIFDRLLQQMRRL